MLHIIGFALLLTAGFRHPVYEPTHLHLPPPPPLVFCPDPNGGHVQHAPCPV